MTKRSKLITFAILMAFSFSLIPLATVSADEDVKVSQDTLNNIEVKCDQIKQSLKRVQNSDKNTRVSIGSSFQTILNNYITPLNVRYLKNNQFNSALNNIQNDYSDARLEFNNTFVSYSQSLEELLKIDCKNDARGFYKKLTETRSRRLEVAKSVTNLKSLIDEHVDIVKELRDGPRSEDE